MSGRLQHSPAHIMAVLLAELDLVSLPDDHAEWPVAVSKEINLPDETVTVYDTAGKLHGRTHYDGVMQMHHGIQVRIRAGIHTTGWDKANAIADALDRSVYENVVTLDSVPYLVIAATRTGDVLSLGSDGSSDRRLFTVNAIVAIRQLS